jgi:hypothetical protein
VLDPLLFLAALMLLAVKNRLPECCCLVTDGLPACKGDDDDPTPPSYLFRLEGITQIG